MTNPASQPASVSFPSAHSSDQTPKIQWQGHCILKVAHGATQNAHGKPDWTAVLPSATWQMLALEDPGRLGLFGSQWIHSSKTIVYTPRIKHTLKITASVPEPLIVMLWHRLQWAHQPEPSTCGTLKSCHIRYITLQINSGKLYLKCAVSC